jgi:hypothetical protein
MKFRNCARSFQVEGSRSRQQFSARELGLNIVDLIFEYRSVGQKLHTVDVLQPAELVTSSRFSPIVAL